MWLFKSFDKKRTQNLLKLSIERMTMLINKKKAEIGGLKKTMKDIMILANSLKAGRKEKQEQALVKAEHLLREKNLVEALDILSNECDKLLARFALFTAEKTLAKEIEESVHTIIWAAPRVNVPELMEIKNQFVLRYGKQVEEDARADGAGRADVRRKLSHSPPADHELRKQCKMISEEYNVAWTDEEEVDVDGYAPKLPPPPAAPKTADFERPPAHAPNLPDLPPPPPFNPGGDASPSAPPPPPPPPYGAAGTSHVDGCDGTTPHDDDDVMPPPPPASGAGGGAATNEPPDNDELERKFSALRRPK